MSDWPHTNTDMERLSAAAYPLYMELLRARHTLVVLDGTPEDSPCIRQIDATLALARGPENKEIVNPPAAGTREQGDTERLDFLQAHPHLAPDWAWSPAEQRRWWNSRDGRFWEDVRAAIDAAMKRRADEAVRYCWRVKQ